MPDAPPPDTGAPPLPRRDFTGAGAEWCWRHGHDDPDAERRAAIEAWAVARVRAALLARRDADDTFSVSTPGVPADGPSSPGGPTPDAPAIGVSAPGVPAWPGAPDAPPADVDAPSARLAARLLRGLDALEDRARRPLDTETHWCLAFFIRYGPWEAIARVAAHGPAGLDGAPLVRTALGEPAPAPPPGGDGLALSHLDPDAHFRAHAGSAARTLLVCFSGNSQRLNIPVPMFHLRTMWRGLPVLYLRDRTRRYFADGIAGLAGSQAALGAFIRDTAARAGCDRIVGLGTSAGGLSACAMAPWAGFDRVLSFSGPFVSAQVGIDLSGLPARYDPRRIRLVLSATDPLDIRLRGEYAAAGFHCPTELIRTRSHMTFVGAVQEGRFERLMDELLMPFEAHPDQVQASGQQTP